MTLSCQLVGDFEGDVMSDNFDPYHKWLGIAPSEQPANHYRLLGLNPFESDLDVIESGSDRQMAHLRSFQTGPRMRECQRLLNEVAGARVVLLDAHKKSAYDELLRTSLAPVQAPPRVDAVPLTPADTLLPAALDPAAPTMSFPGSSSAPATSPVVVAKKPLYRQKHAIGVGALVVGASISLVALFACGYGLRVMFRPSPRPVEPKTPSATAIAPSPRVGSVEPAETPAEPPPTSPAVQATDAAALSRPANAFVDVRDEYNCDPSSQPQLAIDSTFDATKSWRLSFSINAPSHPAGTILCWGDSRAGKDPICIKAGPDFVDGWVMDNTSPNGGTNLPKMSITWSDWHEIELVHDAVAKVLQLRVDDERQNVSATRPPQADRDMPVHLGGIGSGALHAFPCRLRDLRLEQLADPVNLPGAATLATMPTPEVVASKPAAANPETPGSLSELVNSTAASKLAVPAEAKLNAAREQMQRLFAYALAKERSPQESATLADDLQKQAIQSGTQPAMRYVMLEAAIDVAAKGGAVDSAGSAIRELDRVFSVDLTQWKATAVQQIARAAKETWQHKGVAELLEVVIDECLASDRYDLAISLADAATDAARKSKDSSTISRIAARSRDIKSLKAKFEPVRVALELLVSDSEDPTANDLVGQHLCLVKGRWDKGLPYLVKSGAVELRDVAARDIRNPTDLELQAAIAADWWKVATQLEQRLQLHAYRRSEYWYRLAVSQASGLKRLPLEQQINDVGKEIGKLAELPPGAVLVMTFEPSTLKRQGYVLDVSQHGYVGVVHGAMLADGIAGKAFAFDGKNSYIEVAPTPWLSAPSAFTLSAWVNVNSWKNVTSAHDYVLSNEAAGAHGYVLRFRNGGIVDLTVGASEWHETLSTEKASLEVWHHLAATFDGTVSRVFLDGEVVGETPAPIVITPSDQPFRIGQAALSKERGMRGFIDEVAIFNRALSPDEVRTVYRIGRAGRPLME